MRDVRYFYEFGLPRLLRDEEAREASTAQVLCGLVCDAVTAVQLEVRHALVERLNMLQPCVPCASVRENALVQLLNMLLYFTSLLLKLFTDMLQSET